MLYESFRYLYSVFIIYYVSVFLKNKAFRSRRNCRFVRRHYLVELSCCRRQRRGSRGRVFREAVSLTRRSVLRYSGRFVRRKRTFRFRQYRLQQFKRRRVSRCVENRFVGSRYRCFKRLISFKLRVSVDYRKNVLPYSPALAGSRGVIHGVAAVSGSVLYVYIGILMSVKIAGPKVVDVKSAVNRRKMLLNKLFYGSLSGARLDIYGAVLLSRERVYQRYKVVGEEYAFSVLTSIGPAIPYSYKRAQCISVRISLVCVKRYLQIVVYRYRRDVKVRYDSVHSRYYVRRYLLLVWNVFGKRRDICRHYLVKLSCCRRQRRGSRGRVFREAVSLTRRSVLRYSGRFVRRKRTFRFRQYRLQQFKRRRVSRCVENRFVGSRYRCFKRLISFKLRVSVDYRKNVLPYSPALAGSRGVIHGVAAVSGSVLYVYIGILMSVKIAGPKVVDVKSAVNRRKMLLNKLFYGSLSGARLDIYGAVLLSRERVYQRYKVVGEEYAFSVLTSIGPAIPYSYKRAQCISVRISLVCVKRYLQIVVYRYRRDVKVRYDSVHSRYYVRRYLLLVWNVFGKRRFVRRYKFTQVR